MRTRETPPFHNQHLLQCSRHPTPHRMPMNLHHFFVWPPSPYLFCEPPMILLKIWLQGDGRPTYTRGKVCSLTALIFRRRKAMLKTKESRLHITIIFSQSTRNYTSTLCITDLMFWRPRLLLLCEPILKNRVRPELTKFVAKFMLFFTPCVLTRWYIAEKPKICS